MGTVVFISHPIGERDDSPEAWHDNLANASEWIKFFIDTTSWVVLAPWYVYALVHENALMAGRRLIDSMTALERADVCLLIGGVISPHMRDYDARTARRLGLPVVDLTGFGVIPPDKTDEDAIHLIRSRVRTAITSKPRRVWLPLLTQDDLDNLKKARHALYAHIVSDAGEYDTAVALLDRIISAASERGS